MIKNYNNFINEYLAIPGGWGNLETAPEHISRIIANSYLSFNPIYLTDIQKEIKDTLARLSNQGGKSKASKNRRQKRESVAQRRQEEMEAAELQEKILKLTEFVTVSELLLDPPGDRKAAEILRKSIKNAPTHHSNRRLVF